MPQIIHLEELSTETLLDVPPPNLILKTRLCPTFVQSSSTKGFSKEAQKLYSIKIWYDKDAGWNTLQDRLRFHHPAARFRLEHEVPVLHFAGEQCDQILHHEHLLRYVGLEPDDLPILHIHFVPDTELMQSVTMSWIQAPALPLLRPVSPTKAALLVAPHAVSAAWQEDSTKRQIESTSNTADREADLEFEGAPPMNKRRFKVVHVATASHEEQGKDSGDTDDEDTIVVKRPEKKKDKRPTSRLEGGRFATTSKTNLSKTLDSKTDSNNVKGMALQPKPERPQPNREQTLPFYVRIGTVPNLTHRAETLQELDCNLIAIAEVSHDSQVKYFFVPTWLVSGEQVGSLWNAQEAKRVYKLPPTYHIDFDPYFQIGFRENRLEQMVLDYSKRKHTQAGRKRVDRPEALPLLFYGPDGHGSSSQNMVASPLSHDAEDQVNLVIEFADRSSSPRKRRFIIDMQIPVDINCSHDDFLEELWDMEITEDETSLSELLKSGAKDARMDLWVLPQGTEGPWRQLREDGVLREFIDGEVWKDGGRCLYVEVHLFGT